MKRTCLNYGHLFRYHDIVAGSVLVDSPKFEVQESHDANDSFLSIVYSRDKRTNLPTGDLLYLVNDKANPEVKNWILQNLMMDTSAAAAPTAPAGLSDDDIIALSRQSKESVGDYAERINQYQRANIDLYERLSKSIARADVQKPVSTSVDVQKPVSTSVQSAPVAAE